MSSNRVVGGLVCLLAAVCPRAAAQDRLFPRVAGFELPEASPRVHGFAGRILSVTQGESEFGDETEGEAAVGEDIPVIALRRGPRPISLGFGAQVYGRFSLSDPKSSLISTDWMVGMNTTAELGAWTLTAQVYHESSHLGDEYQQHFNATRIDWTREVLAGWVGYTMGPWRVAGNLNFTLVDQLDLSAPGASLGLDFHGRDIGRLFGGGVQPVGGVFVEGAAETDWQLSASVKLGLSVRASDSGRAIGIALIAHDGLSTQRQFFRNTSRYIGGELRFDL